jgi:hypothetical protein
MMEFRGQWGLGLEEGGGKGSCTSAYLSKQGGGRRVNSLSSAIQGNTSASDLVSHLTPMSMFKPDPMESTYIRRRSWN